MAEEVHAKREVAATATGQSTAWLSADVATSLWNGRNFGFFGVESINGATGTITLQVKPSDTDYIVGQLDASVIEITSGELTCVKDFNIMRGWEVRAYVSSHSGTGTLNIIVDLGVS